MQGLYSDSGKVVAEDCFHMLRYIISSIFRYFSDVRLISSSARTESLLPHMYYDHGFGEHALSRPHRPSLRPY